VPTNTRSFRSGLDATVFKTDRLDDLFALATSDADLPDALSEIGSPFATRTI